MFWWFSCFILMIYKVFILFFILVFILFFILYFILVFILYFILVFILVFILLFQVMIMRSVTPLSYVYLSCLALWLIIFSSSRNFQYQYFGGKISFMFLTLWMVIEAIFFPYYYFLFKRLNKINHDLEVSYCVSLGDIRIRKGRW